MEPVKDLALKIIYNLKPEHIKNIKSYVGFLETSCEVVEEACQRLKKSYIKISSEYKKHLAVDLLTYLMDKLKMDGLITSELFDVIKNIIEKLDITNIFDIIDDIVSIWNNINIYTSKLCPCIGKKKKAIRNLKNVKFDGDNSVDKITQV